MQARQGDILIERVDSLPAGLDLDRAASQQTPRQLVLAEGEASGHAHRLVTEGKATLVAAEAADTGPTIGWLVVDAEAQLVHDEHAPIDLPPGSYRVVQQRRYDPRLDRGQHAGD